MSRLRVLLPQLIIEVESLRTRECELKANSRTGSDEHVAQRSRASAAQRYNNNDQMIVKRKRKENKDGGRVLQEIGREQKGRLTDIAKNALVCSVDCRVRDPDGAHEEGGEKLEGMRVCVEHGRGEEK